MNIELNNELVDQKSILSKVDKQYFAPKSEIPSDYFANMEDDFFSKLAMNSQPKESNQSRSIWGKTNLSYRVAAVLAFAIMGVGMFYVMRDNQFKNISQNEVADYLCQEDEVCEYHHVHDETCKDLSKKDIAKYLVEVEGIDVTEIN